MCVSQKEILCRRTDLNNFQPTTAFKIFIVRSYRAYYIYLWKLFSNFRQSGFVRFRRAFRSTFSKKKV